MGLRAKHPYLRISLACATTVNFFTFIGFALLILFASRTLGLIPDDRTCPGPRRIRRASGRALARPLAQRIGVGPLIAIATILFPAGLGLTALAGGPLWSRVGVGDR